MRGHALTNSAVLTAGVVSANACVGVCGPATMPEEQAKKRCRITAARVCHGRCKRRGSVAGKRHNQPTRIQPIGRQRGRYVARCHNKGRVSGSQNGAVCMCVTWGAVRWCGAGVWGNAAAARVSESNRQRPTTVCVCACGRGVKGWGVTVGHPTHERTTTISTNVQ